jgi:hypothetical protein
MPLPKLMAVTESSPEYNEEHRAGMFYAQSWALAHFLICGEDRNNAVRLSRYLERIQHPGVDPDATFREVFAEDFKLLPNKLRAYLDGGRYYQRKAPVPLQHIASAITIRPATAFERDFALLNLRWRVQRPDDAMLAALQLAVKHPTAPRPRELLALIAAVAFDTGLLALRVPLAPAPDAEPAVSHWLAEHGEGRPVLEIPVRRFSGDFVGAATEQLYALRSLVHRLPLIDHGTRPAVLEQRPLRPREASLEHTDDDVLTDVRARLGGPLSDVFLVQADY